MKVLLGVVAVIIFLALVVIAAPVIQERKDKCDELHGFYNPKTGTCFYEGGIKQAWEL